MAVTTILRGLSCSAGAARPRGLELGVVRRSQRRLIRQRGHRRDELRTAEHAELRMFSENFAEIGPGITLLRRPTSLASCHFPVLTPATRERASR